MLIVRAGEHPHTIIRSCRDRLEAEGWARRCIESGITPVMVNGKPFDPESRALGPSRELAQILGMAAPEDHESPASPSPGEGVSDYAQKPR